MKHLLVCFLVFHQISFAQIFINEGCNKNYLSSSDENGDASDWIELHNSGTSPVNLNGYALSDKATVPNMWILPNLSIPAGDSNKYFVARKIVMGQLRFNLDFQNKITHLKQDGVNINLPLRFTGMAFQM